MASISMGRWFLRMLAAADPENARGAEVSVASVLEIASMVTPSSPAFARSMVSEYAIDEMLDTLVNRTGVVGR